ncbi:RHS repeat-associated core domain-containing protein [Streptomyces sp. NRRL S-37]
MGHRYYDPALGRFTQPDPSGQEENPYLYAAGDPVNRVDPTGLLWDDIAGALKSGAKTVGRWAKPTPGYVAACYTTNSILDEDGSDWSEEMGDLWACADPTGGFIPD